MYVRLYRHFVQQMGQAIARDFHKLVLWQFVRQLPNFGLKLQKKNIVRYKWPQSDNDQIRTYYNSRDQ